MRNDVLLAKTIAEAGSVVGRVKLQKMVYLLQRMEHGFDSLQFRLWHHGPFASQLAWLTDAVVAQGLITEDPPEPGSYEPYSYAPASPEMADVLCELEAWRSGFGDVVRELNGHESRLLEVAATHIFLADEEGLSGDDLRGQLVELKGHLESYFDRALTVVEEWRSEGRFPPS